ncbi:type II secretion system protein [Thalassotalea marina]|uniref:MSHA biogenesis protein MshC n=1 Tax=Thalassotalea marina TaxID=1673741 RepID=A0A919EH85_9GAMM|nr:type II secretion system protein [Thalassotalea marina]GHF82851.1 MSHA biogenesis protein MshC [Thalassotalea marina]
MSYRHIKGFTMIELVVVIIILAILSATVIPRWFSSRGFEEYTYKDELIVTLRAVQLKAMQQAFDLCKSLIIENKRIGLLKDRASGIDSCHPNILADQDIYGAGVDGHTSVIVDDAHQISFSPNTTTPWYLRFNAMGQPIATGCSAPCDVSIEINNDATTDEPKITVKVNAQGYIYAEQN